MKARVKTAYKLFAADDTEKAYYVLDELHGEIEDLTNEILPSYTGIR